MHDLSVSACIFIGVRKVNAVNASLACRAQLSLALVAYSQMLRAVRSIRALSPAYPEPLLSWPISVPELAVIRVRYLSSLQMK